MKSTSVCVGPVEWRNHHWISNTIINKPYCQRHWDDKLDLIERVNHEYGAFSDAAPAGVDYNDWTEDY